MKETLEEVAKIYASHSLKEERQKDLNMGFKAGAKHQQERSYSEEEVLEIIFQKRMPYMTDTEIIEWFDQFKKK
jgi:hypothetical protein